MSKALPEQAGGDSFSFLPALLNEPLADQTKRPNLVIATGNRGFTIRVGDWKYIDILGSGGFSTPRQLKPTKHGPKNQLYNLSTDPGETINLTLEHPEISDRLRNQLHQIIDAGQSRVREN